MSSWLGRNSAPEGSDERSEAERKVDEEFNDIVRAILGEDSVDKPMKEHLDTGPDDVVAVVTDPSDPGEAQHYLTADDHERVDIADDARRALRRADRAFPVEDAER